MVGLGRPVWGNQRIAAGEPVGVCADNEVEDDDDGWVWEVVGA